MYGTLRVGFDGWMVDVVRMVLVMVKLVNGWELGKGEVEYVKGNGDVVKVMVKGLMVKNGKMSDSCLMEFMDEMSGWRGGVKEVVSVKMVEEVK